MDPGAAYTDFFRRMTTALPPVYLTPELSAGSPSRDAPSLDGVVEFHKMIEPGATVLVFGAGVSSFVLRALRGGTVVTLEADDVMCRAVEQVCVSAGVAGYDGSFRPVSEDRQADYVFYESVRLDYVPRAFAAAYSGIWVAGGNPERKHVLDYAVTIARTGEFAYQSLPHGVLVRGRAARPTPAYDRAVDKVGRLFDPITALLAPPHPPTRPRPVLMTGPR